ncbi:MAG: WS/DGAT domain-containing protein, partial [Solirubrobacterales bacterium]
RLAASPRMYNLAVSNVPGPRVPLYAAGARVAEIYPVIPISEGHAIAFGVLTYRDSLHFAAYVDPEVLSAAPELGALFRNAIVELEHAVARGHRRDTVHRQWANPSRPKSRARSSTRSPI